MSRIGKMPVTVPGGVTVDLTGQRLAVKGPRGELSLEVVPEIAVARENGSLNVERHDESPRSRALHGLTRTLINNMVLGVSAGFEKTLEIEGVGYRAQMQGDKLNLALGFSHPVEVTPEAGISFRVEPAGQGRVGRIIVAGIDKQRVGEVAARIRLLRPPEPYKGKGLRYAGEHIRRKAGKAGKVGGKKK
ncbi:MAG TPA: 50S ribosomal protein L6 [Chloroflexota bacterium]|nr:50S ribosomal protein L6 [Chloroflexota bacterium]